jgi:hypothetical protein
LLNKTKGLSFGANIEPVWNTKVSGKPVQLGFLALNYFSREERGRPFRIDPARHRQILAGMKSCRSLLAVVGAAFACVAFGEQGWTPGPYLMLDETLLAQQSQVRREINHPSRLPDPIVTGYEDGCFQPWVSVVRDPQAQRFRMWYNRPSKPPEPPTSRLAYLESEDGIHWQRPHRVLTTPPIQFGASVIDEGSGFADPTKRYKFAWWKDGGLQVAFSADGLTWNSLAPGPVLPSNHDVTAIAWDLIRQRYIALISMYPNQRRTPYESVSADLIHWKTPWQIIAPDPNAEIEKGETQFYGISGLITRGRLLVGTVKVLRDDLNCEPGKTAKELHDTQRPYAGLGYTVLGWSHDGESWKRDTEPFLDRNPQPGTWDRAMTWADSQVLVGDFVYLYYGGYRWGHKAEQRTERQIGFAQMPRDRYASLSAGEAKGSIRTIADTLRAASLTVNARVDVQGGELRVRVLDENGKALSGFDWQDSEAIRGDLVAHPVRWKGNLSQLAGRRVAFEFSLERARLYAFDLAR